ncbi:TraR/DksA family transcriptional regulator [Streptomyces alkaliterrae]|uniref:DNA-binding protein n=1 Tax=Streptomyces alkaliterrae TaxID=2213162 RepID=A0A5P0YJM3_9ACTN|nr:TraR/DksA family transcriptional regulator [Streptomyces alkaliterrae]MBB1253243.1 TraR/DksA family transcriptional regulator [Streptomyces alkaliterrae]MBB1260234.1 TraR/DksA family transcriptional regulator [Streptomyces alkaliterrae]MQS00515.1 DNA-binding protein [Streptomyces alkaliterrae]
MVASRSAEGNPAPDEEPDQPAAGAAKKATERTAARKATAKKAAKATPKKATPGKTAAKKTAAKKTAAKKTAAKKTTARKTAAKTAAGKTAAEKTAAKKTTAKKTTAKKTAARAEEQTGAEQVAAKKSTTDQTSAVPPARSATAVAPGELAVRSGEEPWTDQEVADARTELEEEAGRRRSEIAALEEALSGLMRDSGDGAGDDQADTGSKNITREHELALAGNAREILYQTERALERLEAGTYGLCESCGNPIGKARMQAFPRATLCVDCKQKQERR